MNASRILLLLTLPAACTSVDPWRHFPRQSRLPDVPNPGPASAPADARPPVPATGAEAVPADRASSRRAVAADIARMPPSPPPPPAVPAPVLPPPQTSPAPGPQSIITCDAGSCSTPDGRVQGGTGNVYLDRSGRTCHASGGWLQCF